MSRDWLLGVHDAVQDVGDVPLPAHERKCSRKGGFIEGTFTATCLHEPRVLHWLATINDTFCYVALLLERVSVSSGTLNAVSPHYLIRIPDKLG